LGKKKGAKKEGQQKKIYSPLIYHGENRPKGKNWRVGTFMRPIEENWVATRETLDGCTRRELVEDLYGGKGDEVKLK